MTRPTVLICAGHDPSGGAGIQADIEAVAALGGHATTVITTLTDQDTSDVHATLTVDDTFFTRAVGTLCADMPPTAIKTGVLASVAQIERVCAIKHAHPDAPLVVDPVLAAAGGGRLADDSIGYALVRRLMPAADLVTPNLLEARRLTDADAGAETCAHELAKLGTSALVTGGDTDDAVSVLVTPAGDVTHFHHEQLAGGPFHGSGCTLASAIATQLAHGQPLNAAVESAAAYVHACLARADCPGHGQPLPERIQSC
ncbi:bifunctional hydroxymethylpyrimidine kinase/phosphomethylpyrimidine kinase [Salinisphaera orenii]|uniref:bifunctional hydroxymethylpyrimidine kinase/phosphomethylpyrimidine kinase n=1 Tax=Salinisphaera orenii TaxID=856731 RepID=UPI000DBE6D6A